MAPGFCFSLRYVYCKKDNDPTGVLAVAIHASDALNALPKKMQSKQLRISRGKKG